MFYRPDYNMLMCFANGHASNPDQSFYLPLAGLNPVNGPVERLLRHHQTQTIQDLINNQHKFIANNAGYNLFNDHLRFMNESLQSTKMGVKEMDWFKKLLSNSSSKPAEDSKRRFFEYDGKHTAITPTSPGSDISSGFGTMPSPTSDLDSPPILSQPPALKEPPKDTKDTIMYQGRDLLDLYNNMTYQWSFQMAVLPPHTLRTHFQYRSIYHRLGPFGMIDELATQSCSHCDFQTVIPKN